jgi:hypothetical protein
MALSATASILRRTKKGIYRKRVNKSRCRGRRIGCTAKNRCIKTKSGLRRSYCRKRSNRHIRY